MSAARLPDNVYKLPKRPKIVEQAAPPDQRSHAVLPIRAVTDRKLTDAQLRALAILCSYCNRAGVTWVSQKRLATDMQVSQQAISKHLRALIAAGYVEVTSRAFRGEKPNTTRVIYDPSVSLADAIAITSGQEDTRPPEMKRREDREMQEEFTEEQMAANRQRLKELLAGFRNDGMRHTQPRAIGDVMARKPRAKRQPHSQPNTVVDEGELHSQPVSQPNVVVQNTENIGIDVLFKGIGLEINKELKQVLEECLDSRMICTTFEELRARYAAEGMVMPKNPAAIVEMMILMGADASVTRSDGARSR